jgi:hypothetical protein
MWPYWFIFLTLALAAATERTRVLSARGAMLRLPPLDAAWIGTTIVLALFVGYRLEVGGDWFNYLEYLDLMWGQSLAEALRQGDPGFQLLNWISMYMDWGVYGSNILAATIFATGLSLFCRSLPRPWLALAVAVPYLVIVVGMGYTRQGIALALAMIGFVALQRRSIMWFVFWVVLGATFHKTAVLLLPIGAVAKSRQPLVRWGLVLAASVAAYYLFLNDATESLYAGYIETEYQSEGALVRLLMNAVPALILLLSWKRFRAVPQITEIWKWFAWVSLALVPVLFITGASTAVDRIALYMLPLQLVVFSSLPVAYPARGKDRRLLISGILAYYGLVLFIWLNFATHAQFWLPYRFYLLELLP